MERERRLTYALVILALIIAVAWNQSVGTPARVDEVSKRTAEVCQAQNETNAQLRRYILQQTARSRKTIPALEYYRTHPREMRNALYNIAIQEAETKEAFAPKPC